MSNDESAYTSAREALRTVLAFQPSDPLQGLAGGLASFSELREAARRATAPYRTAAGYVSRKAIPEQRRSEIRKGLFRARATLDSRIETTIERAIVDGGLSVVDLLRRPLFGYCKKQGVSLRLGLSTCLPTKLCGGACYAHDGRERVTATILSGCYSTTVARLFERGTIGAELLLPQIRRAVLLATEDAAFARGEYGFDRRPRVRLAHVGEIAAFPRFANWVARAIYEESRGAVDSVVYTRHPGVAGLDPRYIVVNLTLDAASRSRGRWARKGVRTVWSAWNGLLDHGAEVNFLEHHEFTHAVPNGKGVVCPATTAGTERRFCDAFRCTVCFDFPGEGAARSESIGRGGAGAVRIRTFGLMRRSAQGRV